jgi:hypothetical protein
MIFDHEVGHGFPVISKNVSSPLPINDRNGLEKWVTQKRTVLAYKMLLEKRASETKIPTHMPRAELSFMQ